MPHLRPVLLLAACLAVAPTLAAQEWQNLGSREVDFRRDRDVITVTASEGWFKAIKIEVDNGTVEMYRIRVLFKNGEKFSPETRLTFREDTRSRTIDLPGRNRIIQRVEFRYKSQVRTGKATVTLYGLRGDRPGEAASPLQPGAVAREPEAAGRDKREDRRAGREDRREGREDRRDSTRGDQGWKAPARCSRARRPGLEGAR
jgi:hypothetical protein